MPPSTRRKRSIVESEEEKDALSPTKKSRNLKEVVDNDDSSAAVIKNIDNDENNEETVQKLSQEEESVKHENDSEGEDTNNMYRKPSRRKNGFGKSASTGIIQRITIENFMCHRKLIVDLCPNGKFQEIQ
jgi:hypothetical protein